MDTTGIIKPSTRGGYRRALIAVDDASRWIFVVLLKSATAVETCATIRRILQTVASDAHVLKTQIVRSDNGTEFVNTEVRQLFVQAGIKHEKSCPHTSNQNGVAERAIGRLMPIVRTMIAAAFALPTLWGESLHAACHVINRMPCSSNEGDASPFQVRYGRQPSLQHLQPWGITAYVRRTAPQSKILQRADPGMLVGYGHDLTNQKGWRILLHSLRKVVTSVNVTFDTNLDHSVRRRNPQLRSVMLPECTTLTPNVITQPAFPMASPPPPPLPLSAAPAYVPPIITKPVLPSDTGPKTTIVKREDDEEAAPVVTEPAQPRRPFTRSQAASGANLRVKSSWADVMTKADEEISASQPPFTRPRGRPPSNHYWDEQKGEYVPTNPVLTTPTTQRAWILAAIKSDLVADHRTPTTYEEAVNGPDAEYWKAAIQDEIASLRKCAVWKVIVASAIAPGAKAIPTKWVFKIKGDGNGHIARFKARLVVCGYRQKFGRDYDLTFAPVAHAASIRLVLSLAVAHDLVLRQYDVKTAFLYGILPERHKVYLQPPVGVDVPHGHILQLVKAMYGLKQAPLCWNRHLHQTLTKLKFYRSKFDPCVYVQRTTAGIVILAVVVDDIIAAASNPILLDNFEQSMRKTYQLTSLGSPKKLVGLSINTSDDGLTLDQNQFIKDTAREFKQLNCKNITTPVALGDVPAGQSPLLPPGHRYLSLVGSLLWASVTRPDIAVAVGIACTKSKSPTKADLARAIRILRYLLHTPHIKRTLKRPTAATRRIAVFVDSAW